jgi:biotin transport system substrate-specific component
VLGTQAREKTLVDIAVPGQGLLRDAALVVGFALFTAVAAQVSFLPPSWFVDAFAAIGIPIGGTPVPVSLQTLAVGLTGAALGSRRGGLSILLYALAGMAGLPVYAGAVGKILSGEAAFGATDGSLWGGMSFLDIPSGGYIVGFIAAAFVIGWLAERGWDRSVARTALALVIGNVVIYLIGLPWLYAVLSQIPSLNMDLAKTLQFGLWPFIPGDVLKLAVATGVLPGAWALVRRK